MWTMRRSLLAVCGTGVLVVVWAQDVAFEARLSTVPISPREQATTTGSGHAQAELDGRRLSVQGRFEGLQGPATEARLHMGIATGVRGEAIHELEVEQARAGAVSGTVELSRAEAQALRDGRVYIQIHSSSAPDGNLWGWLLR